MEAAQGVSRWRLARRLLAALAALGGVAYSAWRGRGLDFHDANTLWPLADVVTTAAFSLAIARLLWRPDALFPGDELTRRLARAEERAQPLWRTFLTRGIFLALPAILLALRPFVKIEPGKLPIDPYIGLGGVALMSLVTILLPAAAAAAAALAPGRLLRTGVLEGLMITPLAAERLPAALVRAQLRRWLVIILAAAPLYLLALDWGEWLSLLEPIRMGSMEDPVWFTWENFFDPAAGLWPGAIGNQDQVPASAQFGVLLLVSDLLMCWRAAALGAWLGARLQSGVLAAALAAVGALAFWTLRLWLFTLAFDFHQYTVGPMERVTAAFALDCLIFALVTPFFLDRARKAAARPRDS